ncbi:MAG: alpha-amylase family glycosyl hydrolase [Anaerolineaceae bacterium]
MTGNEKLWWQTGVIYQIYPRSFQDSNLDGIGDLKGILSRIDYFNETLKVDAIWLSPFYPSPQADFGYDVSNYTDVDPIYGSLNEFMELIQAMHRRNLKLIIDFVPNHSSDRHPWFIESRSTRENSKRDWYVWRDAKPDGSPPNNWLAVFGGPAWEWDEKSRQYYLHSFLKEQPDLNWRNPGLKKAMLDAVEFWLKRGVDGFRLDVAHFIMKDELLRDNPLNPQPDVAEFKEMGNYDSILHVYDKADPAVHQIFREFRELLEKYDEKSPRYSVGEIHIFEWEKWASFYGNNDELHMPFNFKFLITPWKAADISRVVDELEGAIPDNAWPNYVMGNHDEHRLASRLGHERARQVAMLLLTLRGTPTLYYGDELGMVDVPIPPEKEQDPFGLRVPGLGRDPNRTPMQWDETPNAGFAGKDVASWLPLADDFRLVNVKTELEDPRSMLNLYRSLLEFRRSSPALKQGCYVHIPSSDEDCYVYLRREGNQRILVAINFGEKPASIDLASFGNGTIRVSTSMEKNGLVDLRQLNLEPLEGLVIELAG